MTRPGWIGPCLSLGLVLALCVTAAAAGQRARDLFPDDEIIRVRISPRGEWVAATARKGETYGLFVQRIGDAEIETIISSRSRATRIDFVGDRTLLARFEDGDDRSFLRVDFIPSRAGRLEYERRWIHPWGYLIDPLPLEDGVVLWGFDRGGRNSVHRVDFDELSEFRASRNASRRSIEIGEKVASIEGVTHGWVSDSRGIPILAMRRDETGYTLLYRETMDDSFEEMVRFEDEGADFVWPHGISPDGRNLIVTAYNGGETIGLFVYDPRSRRFVEEIVRKSNADIVDVFIDPVTRDVLSATYETGGEVQQYYLESSRALYAKQLGPDDPPIDEIRIVSSSSDRQRFIYWRQGPTEPGAHYFRSAATDESILIGQRAVEIDRERLVEPEAFRVASNDGTSIEAFLTRPRKPTVEPVPLVVMPHGGPIGVRDSAEYDPMVQYLASWGMAILQVNYRGSSGYGRSFREAGKKEWARGIEDDIDAAVEFVMAMHEIDERMLCIIGGSYGGFSAIASVIRHPSRYRCAITINGVSDIPLIGESSDIADSEHVRTAFEEVAGDFETERDRLLEISPVYHLQEVETPIQIVYGDRDRRVDPDHGVRLAMMLRLYGKEFDEIRVDGGEHSFTRDQWIGVMPHVRKFLSKHLMPSRRYEKDPR